MIRRILISLLIIILAQATYMFMKDFNAQYPTNDFWETQCKTKTVLQYERGDVPVECAKRYREGKLD